MEIQTTSDYRFYTTEEIANPGHDRRCRHGVRAKRSWPAGTQVRVVVTACVFKGAQVGGVVKHYYLDGYPARSMEPVCAALEAMDPGHDVAPRTIADLADRHGMSAEWFSHDVLARMVETGAVTLEQIEQHWREIGP